MENVDAVNDELLSEITLFQRPLTVTFADSSNWAWTYRIDIKDESAADESYFMKVSFGEHGRESLKGEFESTSAIHAVVGDFTPKPIMWGSFKGLPNAHYYVCNFHFLELETPDATDFPRKIADLHNNSVSPNGKFGFHVVTYNGDLPQENSYADTWEEFFSRGFQHMLDLSVERGGPWEEMETLRPAMLSKVIPRLLRPMETGGRSIKPSLVHGDLWRGNTAFDTRARHFIVFDPSSFYAHNEYELGNWKPARNKFGEEHFAAYKRYNGYTDPKADFYDRNALYSIRFNLHAAALFPEHGAYRVMVIDEMKNLIAKYPGGYEEYESQLEAKVEEIPIGT